MGPAAGGGRHAAKREVFWAHLGGSGGRPITAHERHKCTGGGRSQTAGGGQWNFNRLRGHPISLASRQKPPSSHTPRSVSPPLTHSVGLHCDFRGGEHFWGGQRAQRELRRRGATDCVPVKGCLSWSSPCTRRRLFLSRRTAKAMQG